MPCCLALLLLLAGSASAAWDGYRNRAEAKAAARDLEVMSPGRRHQLWREWKAANGRRYADGSGEDSARFAAWSANLKAVLRHNLRSNITTIQALNTFSDMSFVEFQNTVLMRAMPPSKLPDRKVGARMFSPGLDARSTRKLMQTLPLRWDWRARGKVPLIRTQGNCGSCWAFAAIGALEIKSRIDGVAAAVSDQSEQQMVDCITTSSGCNGGVPADVFRFVSRNPAATEAAYPYRGVRGACRMASVSRAGALSVAPSPGFQWVPASPAAIMRAISSHGPVVIYFNVMPSFLAYAGGIYQASLCKPNTVNHAMIAVGYNAAAGVGSPNSYWIVRNSWGAGWGERGYARVQMTNNNAGACGMYSYVMLPYRTARRA